MDGQLKVISHAELRLTDNEESVTDLEGKNGTVFTSWTDPVSINGSGGHLYLKLDINFIKKIM